MQHEGKSMQTQERSSAALGQTHGHACTHSRDDEDVCDSALLLLLLLCVLCVYVCSILLLGVFRLFRKLCL